MENNFKFKTRHVSIVQWSSSVVNSFASSVELIQEMTYKLKRNTILNLEKLTYNFKMRETWNNTCASTTLNTTFIVMFNVCWKSQGWRVAQWLLSTVLITFSVRWMVIDRRQAYWLVSALLRFRTLILSEMDKKGFWRNPNLSSKQRLNMLCQEMEQQLQLRRENVYWDDLIPKGPVTFRMGNCPSLDSHNCEYQMAALGWPVAHVTRNSYLKHSFTSQMSRHDQVGQGHRHK